MMHSIEVVEKQAYPEGSVFHVRVGCREYYSTDRAFVAEWISAYIADHKTTEDEWRRKYTGEDEQNALVPAAPCGETLRRR